MKEEFNAQYNDESLLYDRQSDNGQPINEQPQEVQIQTSQPINEQPQEVQIQMSQATIGQFQPVQMQMSQATKGQSQPVQVQMSQAINGQSQPVQVQTRQMTQIELETKVNFHTYYGVWSIIVIVFLLSLSAIVWRGGAVEWLLFSTSSFFIVSSGLLPWLAATGLSLDRKIAAGSISEGEITAELNLRRAVALPGVWYGITERFENKSKLEQNIVSYRMIFTPLFHKLMTARYQMRQLPRGSYEALPTELMIGDWLGITCLKRKLKLPNQLTILPLAPATAEGSYLHSFTAQRWHNKQSIWQEQSLQSRLSSNEHNEGPIRAQQSQEAFGDMTRPYIEGEDYRRIDVFAAARGRGLHTRIHSSDFEPPPFCIVLDQYGASFQGGDKDLLFESMISWGLHDVVIEGRDQPVSIVTDDWNFEYYSTHDDLELRCLLAKLRADVKQRMKDRLPQLSALLPSQGHIRVYSGDWREDDSWRALAELAWLKGSTVELHFVTASRVMSYAMRERHKELEQSGLKVVWRYCSIDQQQLEYVMEGEEQYASS